MLGTLNLRLFYVTCCMLCWFSFCNYVYSVTFGGIAKRINATSTEYRLNIPVQSPFFHSISLAFVLISISSPFRGFLNNRFRSKIYIQFLPTLYFLSATKRCAQPNLLIPNMPQIISLTTDVTLSYTETHIGPKITASNQSCSELIASFPAVYIASVDPFFIIALHAQ